MTNSSWWAVALAATLGGTVGAFVSRALDDDSDRASPHSEPPSKNETLSTSPTEGSSPERGDESEERIRRLEHRLALLTAALQRSEISSSSKENGDAPGDSEENDTTDVADPVFEAAVLDIVDRERERKEEERATWRKELHAERGRRYAAQLSEALHLTERQNADLARVVAAHFDEWRALRDEESPNRPTTRKEWRAASDRIQRSTLEKLEEVLGPKQFAAYEALDPDEKLGWGRRRQSDSRQSRNQNAGE